MSKQFFYTRKEGKEGEEKFFLDSFNVDCVTRTMATGDGKQLVVLNDGHEETTSVPKKTKNKVEITKERGYYISQIYLEKEDVERFIKLVGITEDAK
jgi:hypothetical protein